LTLGIAITTEVEDEMSNGIRGIPAIGEDVVEGFETSDRLVLAEGYEEIGKLVLRDLKPSDSFG
jgi:hypothetical protein